ncbi:MAG: ptk 1, partial [Acidobacteria bacterium]|nr:ptk 1 [Acidobacteriota bacterium]
MKESREIVQKHITETLDLERQFEPQVVANSGRYPAYREINSAEGLQLIDYWRAIRKRLWLVIGITVLITTLAAIYVARKPNIYMAIGTVQVDSEQANPDLVSSDRRMNAQTDLSYFNTQLQLLTSETLLRRVIKEHSLDSNKEFQLAKSEESVSAWQSMLKAVGLAGSSRKKQEKGIGEVSPAATSSLASSEEIAEAIRLAPYVSIIQKSLSVEPVREGRATVKDTRLISVSYRHSDPELAAFIVNGIIETFSKSNQEKRTGTNRKTSDFLDERIANL